MRPKKDEKVVISIILELFLRFILFFCRTTGQIWDYVSTHIILTLAVASTSGIQGDVSVNVTREPQLRWWSSVFRRRFAVVDADKRHRS